MLSQSDKLYLKSFVEDGRFDRLLDEIKHEIALSVLGTAPQDGEVREDLYTLARGLDALKMKLQECANLEESKE